MDQTEAGLTFRCCSSEYSVNIFQLTRNCPENFCINLAFLTMVLGISVQIWLIFTLEVATILTRHDSSEVLAD